MTIPEEATLEVPLDDVSCSLCGEAFAIDQPVRMKVGTVKGSLRVKIWVIHESCFYRARGPSIVSELLRELTGECDCPECTSAREAN